MLPTRTKLVLVGLLVLGFGGCYFQPDTRQTIELKLVRGDVPAADVEVALFQPQGRPGECTGIGVGALFGGENQVTRSDGTARWVRKFSPIRARRTSFARRSRAFDLGLCVRLDGRPEALWVAESDRPRREIRLSCDLESNGCRFEYGFQIDEVVSPFVKWSAIGLVLLAMVGGRRLERSQPGGPFYLLIFGYMAVFIWAYGFHGIPLLSKGLHVLLASSGAVLLAWVLFAFVTAPPASAAPHS